MSPLAIFESKADEITIIFRYSVHRDVKYLARRLLKILEPVIAVRPREGKAQTE